MSALWYTLAGIVVGGIITYLVSRHYYVRAARSLEQESAKLQQETARLQRHTNLILRGLEEAGLVEYNRNEQGEIVGLVIKVSASVGSSSSVSVTPTVVRGENGAPQHPQAATSRPWWRRVFGSCWTP